MRTSSLEEEEEGRSTDGGGGTAVEEVGRGEGNKDEMDEKGRGKMTKRHENMNSYGLGMKK